MLWRAPRAFSQQADPILAGRPLVRYPEKTDLILMTSRPPQLETPMTYFDRAITPNEAFFVRYHTFPVPTGVDLGTWRLRVTGLVERPLELSFEDLKTRFPKAAVTAVTQCAGNSRGRFSPRVLGGEWGDGAMGNAEWVGARLRDLLAAAGVRQGAVQATFEGLDKPAFPSVPHFVKSLDLRRIVEDPDVIVAYQMNGRELPMLNGFPARLVVPGWYGDRGRRPRVREVLDEAGLPDSRHAVRLRRARHGAEEHRADPPHDGPLLHRLASERRARRRRATRDAQGHRV
ncbi:MAG: hypothetical protein AUJ05_02995 [Candidatus Rokubacteria bacterium 13_1_40CM_3_69_38]|nr:MAG: hypothetical protein AUJ05_02995 [Candidatus Rokubacteria bacterium 13_1_40CM_3_69_38]